MRSLVDALVEKREITLMALDNGLMEDDAHQLFRDVPDNVLPTKLAGSKPEKAAAVSRTVEKEVQECGGLPRGFRMALFS